MSITATLVDNVTQPQSRPHSARVARVEIFDSFAAAHTVWTKLHQPANCVTPFQRYDFITSWQNSVGVETGTRPFVVAAYDSGNNPLMLLPLVTQRMLGCEVAAFPGGKHSTFNMPLWQREFAANATREDMELLKTLIGRASNAVDVLALHQQPESWEGTRNPFVLLPHQATINKCPLMTIEPNASPTARISSSFRRRLKGKERKLEAMSGYRYTIARSEADVTRLIDAFFTIKPLRMAAQNLPNVFADPGVEKFVRDACSSNITQGSPAIEIHALECDEEAIAIFAGVADGKRFSMMFNTYTMSENSKFSPGLILIRNIVDHYAALGYTSLDLGIGSDDYKLLFCKDDEPLFDSFLPLTIQGSAAAVVLSGANQAKRILKRSPAVADMLRTLHHRFSR